MHKNSLSAFAKGKKEEEELRAMIVGDHYIPFSMSYYFC